MLWEFFMFHEFSLVHIISCFSYFSCRQSCRGVMRYDRVLRLIWTSQPSSPECDVNDECIICNFIRISEMKGEKNYVYRVRMAIIRASWGKGNASDEFRIKGSEWKWRVMHAILDGIQSSLLYRCNAITFLSRISSHPDLPSGILPSFDI